MNSWLSRMALPTQIWMLREWAGFGETKELGQRLGPPPECTSSCSFMVLVVYKVIRFNMTKGW